MTSNLDLKSGWFLQAPRWHWAGCGGGGGWYATGQILTEQWGMLGQARLSTGHSSYAFPHYRPCDTLRHVVTLSAVVSQHQEWPCIVYLRLLPVLLVLISTKLLWRLIRGKEWLLPPIPRGNGHPLALITASNVMDSWVKIRTGIIIRPTPANYSGSNEYHTHWLVN